MARGKIEIKNLEKYYGEYHALQNISLSIEPGTFVSLLGPSGCGKTTLLRSIAGFETIRSGDILIDGKSVIKDKADKRDVHMVFQHYALFPHMNVYDNVAYGLKIRHVPKAEIRDKVEKALSLVRLDGFEKRLPSQMSGGQKQRVSIARALVNESPVLLLDEPLTALDMKLRKEMRYELRRIQQELGITFIYVTHDQEEAMVMSDFIAIMHDGVIEQAGRPRDIYLHPHTAFVSDFIGESDAIEGEIAGESGDVYTVNCEAGTFQAAKDEEDQGGVWKAGNPVNASIRPQNVKWSGEPVIGFNLEMKVEETVFTGTYVSVVGKLKSGREMRISSIGGASLPAVGSRVFLYWDPADMNLLDMEASKLHEQMDNINLREWILK